MLILYTQLNKFYVLKVNKQMTEREMFEASFKRPKNFFKLTAREQWNIDAGLGILDWNGDGLTKEDKKRFDEHYK